MAKSVARLTEPYLKCCSLRLSSGLFYDADTGVASILMVMLLDTTLGNPKKSEVAAEANVKHSGEERRFFDKHLLIWSKEPAGAHE